MEEERKQSHSILCGIILYINSFSTSLSIPLKHMVRAIITHEKPLKWCIWYSILAQCCAVTQIF